MTNRDPLAGLRPAAPPAGLRSRVLAAARQAAEEARARGGRDLASTQSDRVAETAPVEQSQRLRRLWRLAALVLLALNLASWLEERGRVAAAATTLAVSEPAIELSVAGTTLRLRPARSGMSWAGPGAASSSFAGE